ncbi:MAG: hypothetical protein HC819_17175 [Cyclobacteriaceae bacterium]|nr:hypothetical protein [Cyclobacteriaceae bacterium]
MKKIIFLICVLPLFAQAQEYIKPVEADKTRFENQAFYEVKNYTKKQSNKKQVVKNIIFMVGDGMGTSQVYAGLVANKGNLYLKTMPVAGFNKTNSADDLITDSAAGATAFAIGEKTNNGAIGVDVNGIPKKPSSRRLRKKA